MQLRAVEFPQGPCPYLTKLEHQPYPLLGVLCDRRTGRSCILPWPSWAVVLRGLSTWNLYKKMSVGPDFVKQIMPYPFQLILCTTVRHVTWRARRNWSRTSFKPLINFRDGLLLFRRCKYVFFHSHNFVSLLLMAYNVFFDDPRAVARVLGNKIIKILNS